MHLGLRPRLDLRLGPWLHLGLRAHRGLYPRRSLRRRLGLAGGAAGGLQWLGSSFLPPRLRRQAPGAGGLRRRTRRCGPRSNRGGWRPRPDTRTEFSWFNPFGRRGAGLYLSRFGPGSWLYLPRLGWDPGLHPGRLGRNDGLNLSRPGLGARLELPRWRRYARLHLTGRGGVPGWTWPGPGWVAVAGVNGRALPGTNCCLGGSC